jgi:hypothetical protein
LSATNPWCTLDCLERNESMVYVGTVCSTGTHHHSLVFCSRFPNRALVCTFPFPPPQSLRNLQRGSTRSQMCWIQFDSAFTALKFSSKIHQAGTIMPTDTGLATTDHISLIIGAKDWNVPADVTTIPSTVTGTGRAHCLELVAPSQSIALTEKHFWRGPKQRERERERDGEKAENHLAPPPQGEGCC